jgi:hypothetical protein
VVGVADCYFIAFRNWFDCSYLQQIFDGVVEVRASFETAAGVIEPRGVDEDTINTVGTLESEFDQP